MGTKIKARFGRTFGSLALPAFGLVLAGSLSVLAQAEQAGRSGRTQAAPAGVEAIVNDAKSAAEASQRAAQQQKSQGAAKKKTTDVSFDDVLVQGKYHFSDEAVTTVEQDKVLDALLGVRTDFKDRIRKSSSRY